MEEFSALVEDGEEVELNLGLSIGGNPRNLQKLKSEATPNNSVSHIVNAFIDSGKLQQNCKNRPMWQHEAWRKGEENWLSCVSVEDKEFQSRVKDRERKENEATRSERICKKDKGGKNGGIRDEQKNVNLCYETNQTLNQNPYSDLNAFTSRHFHFVPIQYTFPFTNGFSFPYVMPCWAATADTAAIGSDNNVFCRICHSCQTRNPDATYYSLGSCVTEKSSLGSNGSLESTSSAISDHHGCISIQGRTSRVTTSSHSSHKQDRLNVPVVTNVKGQSVDSAFSHYRESSQGVDEATNFTDKKVFSSTAAQSSLANVKDKAFIEPILSVKKSLLKINKNPLSPTSHHNHHPLRKAKVDRKKPPRPRPKQPQSPTAVPQMPCVSTTGNGPNGKTINGFLYRYTKTEISIICACHGSSFSPAEFVEHAGGTDISNPLKCIKLHCLYLPNS